MEQLLDRWASDWGVSPLALQDLRLRFMGLRAPEGGPTPGMSEAAVSSRFVRDVAYDRPNFMFFRNNVGAMQDANGRVVRYGLANESVKQNRVLKSADHIGWESHAVTMADVGQVIARFTCVETKAQNWAMPVHPDPRTAAQLNWAALVNNAGGRAYIYNGRGPLPF